ncbi:hypothetical protein D3C73_1176520 [compost metagenome]
MRKQEFKRPDHLIGNCKTCCGILQAACADIGSGQIEIGQADIPVEPEFPGQPDSPLRPLHRPRDILYEIIQLASAAMQEELKSVIITLAAFQRFFQILDGFGSSLFNQSICDPA